MNYDNNFTNEFTSSFQFIQETDIFLEENKEVKKGDDEKEREQKIQSGIDQQDSTIPQDTDFPQAVEDYDRSGNRLVNQKIQRNETKEDKKKNKSDNYWYHVLNDIYNLSIDDPTILRLNQYPDEQYDVLETVFKFAPGSTKVDYQYQNRSVDQDRSLKLEFNFIHEGVETNPVYKIEFLKGDNKPLLNITFLYDKLDSIDITESTLNKLPNDYHLVPLLLNNLDKKYVTKDQDVDDTYPVSDGDVKRDSKQYTFMTSKENKDLKFKLLYYLAKLEHDFNYDSKKDNTIGSERIIKESILVDGIMFDLYMKMDYGQKYKAPKPTLILVDEETHLQNEDVIFIYGVSTRDFKLKYLGPVSENYNYKPETKEYKKTKENYEIERFYRENPDVVDKIDFYGLQNIVDLKERLIVMEEANKLVLKKNAKDDIKEIGTHIDTEIVVYENATKGKTLLYSFIIGREENGVIPVKVEKLGEKEVDSNDDLSNMAIEKIHGYQSSFTADELKEWLEKRYKSLEGKINVTDKEQIKQKAEEIITENSKFTAWFKTNYTIEIVQLSNDKKTKFAKDRLEDGNDGKKGKYHKNVDGIKDFTKDELIYLELSLQKMSKSTLKMLEGIDFVRINELKVDPELDDDDHVHEASGIASRKVTVDEKGKQTPDSVIYISDKAYERYGIVGDSEQLSTKKLWTKTHEMGHALAYNLIEPKMPVKNKTSKDNYKTYGKVTIDDEFHNFLLMIKEAYNYIVPGVTDYARESAKIRQDKNEEEPYVEYFAEAFTLYHLDPQFLKINRPAVYAWFEYVLTKGKAPGWNSIIIEDEGAVNREPRTFKDISKEEVDLFKHLKKEKTE